MPTIAISSSCATAVTAGASAASWRPVSSARRYRARAVGVGWSKTSEGGRLRPVELASWFLSSTAVNESNPISWNGWAAGMASACGCPRMAAASACTCWTSTCCCSLGGVSASCRARALPAEAGWSPGVSAASAGVRSASRGLGRWAVKLAGNLCQSMSAMVMVVSLWVSAWCRALTASSGGSGFMPRRL